VGGPPARCWLFLASVLDLGSRRFVGYPMAVHMRTELVTDALSMAVTPHLRRRGDRAR
jgi:putative transposase